MGIIKPEGGNFNPETCRKSGKTSLIEDCKFISALYIIPKTDVESLLRKQFGTKRKVIGDFSAPANFLTIVVIILRNIQFL